MASSHLIQLMTEIQRKAASPTVTKDDQLRQTLLQSARNLIETLEGPIIRLTYTFQSQPFTIAATRTLLDLKVFTILSDSQSPQTVSALAKTTGCEEKLLSRLLKHLATSSYVHEAAPDVFAANDTTRLIASPGGQGMIKDLFNVFKTSSALPSFLKETEYKNPVDKDRSLFKYAYGTEQHYFDYVFADTAMTEAFKNHMVFKAAGPKWHDDPTIIAGLFENENLSKEDVLLVDMGGNKGHDLLGFRTAHPSIHGRCILQDLPDMVATLDSSDLAASGIEIMAHDIFTPQPVRDAKCYFLKYILHDWPAEQCKLILENARLAMKVGWSRLLVVDIVVAEQGASWWETSLDLLMLGVHSAMERREGEWRDLIEGVEGLRIVKTWTVRGAVERVLEIERVE